MGMNGYLRVTILLSLVSAAPLLTAAPARATRFTVLASGLSYTPYISAVKGATAYGTTQYGGTNSGGTLFTVTSAKKVTTIYNFNPATDGNIPNDMLAIDAGGNVYGTTQQGGQFSGGTIFKLSPARKLTVLHAFDPAAGDGSGPLQGVVRGGDGTLYGAAAGGAISTNGSVFQMTAKNVYSTRYEFKSQGDGHCPFSGVAVDAADNIYGTVVGGGFGGDPNGAVWRLAQHNRLTPLYKFKDGADGEYPDQAPIVDAAGNVYGTILKKTTNAVEDASYAGAIWKIDTTGQFSIFYQFTGKTDGYGPNGPLLLNTDGNFYGTTGSGGGKKKKPGYGTLFRITPAGVFTVLRTFYYGPEGGGPTGTLAHDSRGAIYGGTSAGTVYKYVP
jgi:uncharacterized repeat protein (TIGR03803 family)